MGKYGRKRFKNLNYDVLNIDYKIKSMSDGSFDSLNVEKGSIETETKSVHDKPFIRLKPNSRPGAIPSNVLKDMQHYSHHHNRDSVQLERPHWKNLNLSYFLKFVMEWRAIKIWAYNNECPILKDIKNISFPCLIWINLSANHFMSIQCLSRIKMPNLENIQLPANCLITIKTLRKCHWPSIRQLSLSRNQIRDWEYLGELFVQKDFTNLEYFENPDITDFRTFVKLEPKRVALVEIFDCSFVTERQEDVYQRRNALQH